MLNKIEKSIFLTKPLIGIVGRKVDDIYKVNKNVVLKIIDTINESKKGALISSAKLIASAAENAMLSNQALGISEEITCADVSNFNQDDYECSIRVLGSTPYVTLIGKGKFEGQSICYASKDSGVKVQGSVCPPLAVEKIESLAIEGNTEGLVTDDFGNIRYAGASPKNYIKFNGEDWRIIGIFEMKTARGTTEKLMKIVRDAQFTQKMSWDSSASDVNGGKGVNEWSQADLMTMLNKYYIGTSTTCSYCSDSGQDTCLNDCSSSVTAIGNTYTLMIEEVVWNTGAITGTSSIERSSAYTQERETTTGKVCTSGDYCNDSVTRTTTWQGKVGLIYPSDYGYASTSGTNIRDISSGTTNWLNTGHYYWTISPIAYSNDAINAWAVYSGYVASYDGARCGYGVRPTVYLRSSVLITNGGGTKESPYQISM